MEILGYVKNLVNILNLFIIFPKFLLMFVKILKFLSISLYFGIAAKILWTTWKILFKKVIKCYQFSEQTDFWVPLLEKAFAKFCGSYRSLIAGNSQKKI